MSRFSTYSKLQDLILYILLTYTVQIKFPNCDFRDLNLKIHILLGKLKVAKDIQFSSAQNKKSVKYLICWKPLTNARDVVISLLVVI